MRSADNAGRESLDEELDNLKGVLQNALHGSDHIESIAARDLVETIQIVVKLAEEEHGGNVHAILREENLWSLIEQIEALIEHEETIVDIELELQEELHQLETLVITERDAAVEEMLATPRKTDPSPRAISPQQLSIIQDDTLLRQRYTESGFARRATLRYNPPYAGTQSTRSSPPRRRRSRPSTNSAAPAAPAAPPQPARSAPPRRRSRPSSRPARRRSRRSVSSGSLALSRPDRARL